MELTSEELRCVQELAGRLKCELGAEQVLLYGSAVRGTMSEASDIDLLAVLPEVNWALEKDISDLCFQAELRLDRVVSVAVFSRREYGSSPLRRSPFVLAAQAEGIRL